MILTKFANISFSSIAVVMPIHHKNMNEIEFSALAAKLRICLIFTGRHS